MLKRRLPEPAKPPICKRMDPAPRDLLARTEPPRRPNGERKLAHNVFMQITWGLLAVAAVGQLVLLVWLDVTS